MINQVVLVGRITTQPEVRYTSNQTATVSFSLAVARPVSSQNGERQTDFINCVAWRQQAEFLGKYVQKGNMLGVTGRIQVRSYQAQDGSNRQAVEVVCDSVQNLSPRDASQQTNSQEDNNSYQPRQKEETSEPAKFTRSEVADEDLPF